MEEKGNKPQLLGLLSVLEMYLKDDIRKMTEQGYKDRPGTALNIAKTHLGWCEQWQQKLKEQ